MDGGEDTFSTLASVGPEEKQKELAVYVRNFTVHGGQRVVLCVLLSFTLNRSFCPRSVHPVSVLILNPREIQIMWSQTETEKNQNNRN